MRPRPLLVVWSTLLVASALAKLDCDPTSNIKKPAPDSPESYLYCNLEGTFSKRKCIPGKIFNPEKGECESLKESDDPDNDPFSKPFYQAPDDLCGGGIPLTILSAPVACNPSISSCPDGYVCRMYEKTGTSYCCQGGSTLPSGSSSGTMCSKDQVTYIDTKTGKPQECALTSPGSCPTGFGCNLVRGTTTRCCGKDHGCPFNSAAFLDPNTASYVECSPSARSSCQPGFSCIHSTTLRKNICCSNPPGSSGSDSCPGGDLPLATPSSCSVNSPCPSNYVCRDGKCCPSSGVCPAGLPLGGGPTTCNDRVPCKEGYQCVTNAGTQYCCPNREGVCKLPKNSGVACASSRPAFTRYYFDNATGSCRSFQFSQCGGNANNFNSLEECEGFCVDAQCKNGQAYRVGAVNAVCVMTSASTCPQQYSCQGPVYGPSSICCPTPELTCSEMVSAGTPCFGRTVTLQRFYFNQSTRRCQAFQYYGCNGNGNNFGSMDECNEHCLSAVDSVCGGVAPLLDPNQQPQRCSDNVPCPSGYDCNPENYCCPSSATACGTSFSRGNVCSGSIQRSMWYFDSSSKKCSQFAYNGCGGTANRFISQKSCQDMCIDSNAAGSCPRGMTPVLDEVLPKSCTLNVQGTCPAGSSCVRSTANQPICCQTVTICPDSRSPYVIPGSTSVVACNLDADECPDGNVCLESNVAGFFMCCSEAPSSQRPPQRGKKPQGGPDSLAALMRTISPCPPALASNGQTCTVNAIGECPDNYLCYKDTGFELGSCCRTGQPPKCSQKTFIPVFLEGTQVQICHADHGGCPRDSKCMTSTVPKLAICCKKYSPPTRAGPSSQSLCKNGVRPFYSGNEPQECNFVFNTCPDGHKCEFSSTGKPVCCADQSDIRCPHGTSAFEFGGRPLACPPGSFKCPSGYSCLASTNPQYHLCCSTGIVPTQPQCARGEAYTEPTTNERRFCSPIANNCPIGYQCMESDRPGQFICCTQGDLTERFKGFCPPRQIPYVSREGFPPTCHMQLNPCPTTAPYVCIYSPQKQDSFCCAPIDTAVRSLMVPDNVAARPGKFGNIDYELPNQNVPVPDGNPMAGMTATFPGGPIAPGMGGIIGMPDPIPGVAKEKLLPPGFVNAGSSNNNFGQGSIGFGGIERFGQNNFGQNGGFKGQQFQGGNNNNNFGQQNNLGQNNFGQNNFGQGSNNNFGGIEGMQNTFNSFSMNKLSSQLAEVATGCPLGSRPLVRTDRSVVECAERPCPEGFACVFAERESRFQCCSASSIMLAATKIDNNKEAATSSPVGSNGQSSFNGMGVECPPGFFLIDGKCLKVLFAGQKGCISDDQCSMREANSTCDSGYCICPVGKPLVHGGKCVSSCPEGFANIAGRCYDPTTVIFMDSVDERINGTVGGYCKETLIEEKRCDVENAFCSEKTITCTCKPGFELEMDFNDKNDKGSCRQLESSKFAHAPQAAPPAVDDELYFIDIAPKMMDETNSTALEDDVDLSKFLLPQTDELIPVFA